MLLVQNISQLGVVGCHCHSIMQMRSRERCSSHREDQRVPVFPYRRKKNCRSGPVRRRTSSYREDVEQLTQKPCPALTTHKHERCRMTPLKAVSFPGSVHLQRGLTNPENEGRMARQKPEEIRSKVCRFSQPFHLFI
jgi:hypothetical protein